MISRRREPRIARTAREQCGVSIEHDWASPLSFVIAHFFVIARLDRAIQYPGLACKSAPPFTGCPDQVRA
jgi:hypothetical protein